MNKEIMESWEPRARTPRFIDKKLFLNKQIKSMKNLILLLLFIPLVSFGQQQNYPYKWPMHNDINVNLKVENPSYEVNDGPLIMFDSEISK